MAIVVPGVAKNYQSPVNWIQSKWGKEPPEGRGSVPMEIDWGVMGGPNNVVSINLQNNSILPISQIGGFTVDNSSCGADIQFIFTDTAETITVPAYTPKAIIPVNSNSLQFYVSSPNAIATDVTRFAALNFTPAPLAVPVTEELDVAVFDNIAVVAGAGNTQVVPAGVNGSIEGGYIQHQLNSAASGTVTWTLQDGESTPLVIAGGQDSVPASNVSGTSWSLQKGRVRFQNGLKFVWTAAGTAAGSAMAVNLYYRTP